MSKRVIIPLSGKDLTAKRAQELIETLGPNAYAFKFHLPKLFRFYREGVDLIALTRENESRVMLDLKGHDIPTETADMVRDCNILDCDIITVHGCGGFELLDDVVKTRGKAEVYVVTVLTSTDEENCNIDLGGPVKAKVLQWARNAAHTGCDGTVSSAAELDFLRKQRGVSEKSNGDRMRRITPGIRPTWHIQKDEDQKRIVTPAQAIKSGADFLVIGRPILEAKDPLEAIIRTNDEIAKATGGA